VTGTVAQGIVAEGNELQQTALAGLLGEEVEQQFLAAFSI
jgi:hypothetical protein